MVIKDARAKVEMVGAFILPSLTACFVIGDRDANSSRLMRNCTKVSFGGLLLTVVLASLDIGVSRIS